MAKRVDPLIAKQRKQKKIAIVLGLLLLLVGAYQGPKTLKMLQGPPQATAAAAEAAPAPTPATPATGTPAPAAAPSAGAPTAAPNQPAVLANSDTPVDAEAGQLLSFERFESHDPFQQQVDLKEVATDATAPDADSSAGSTTAPPAPDADSAVVGSADNPPISVGTDAPSGSGSSGSGSSGGSSGGAAPAGQAPAAPAAATTISVNGVAQTVSVGVPFPTDQPTFNLVSIAKDGKSVQLGIAGGSLSGGKATLKLQLGKPLTLENTADGTRYKLVLLTVEGMPAPTG
jgi:hypothetical protein